MSHTKKIYQQDQGLTAAKVSEHTRMKYDLAGGTLATTTLAEGVGPSPDVGGGIGFEMIRVNGMMTNLRITAYTDPDGKCFHTRLQLAGMPALKVAPSFCITQHNNEAGSVANWPFRLHRPPTVDNSRRHLDSPSSPPTEGLVVSSLAPLELERCIVPAINF